jgi:DNA-binding NtrC family response regulator
MHPATVLLIDQEEGSLRALLRSFLEEGYRVFATAQPRAALELCAREAVDLVLCDLELPGGGGLELLREIKTRHPQILQVVLSGRTDFAAALEAINRIEVHRYLTKPSMPRRCG